MTDVIAAEVVGTADHYAAFVKLVRLRIEQLGITYETVDALAGFPQRYTNILLSGGRAMSVYSMFTLVRVLCLTPQFAHDQQQHELMRAREDWVGYRRAGPRWRSKNRKSKNKLGPDFLHNRALKGGLARARSLPPRRRRAIARLAGRARWGNGAKQIP